MFYDSVIPFYLLDHLDLDVAVSALQPSYEHMAILPNETSPKDTKSTLNLSNIVPNL